MTADEWRRRAEKAESERDALRAACELLMLGRRTVPTPGPWLFRGKSSSIHAAPKNEPGERYQYGEQIARFAEDEYGAAMVSDDNLALILAAPVLLSACRRAARMAIRDLDDAEIYRTVASAIRYSTGVAREVPDADR